MSAGYTAGVDAQTRRVHHSHHTPPKMTRKEWLARMQDAARPQDRMHTQLVLAPEQLRLVGHRLAHAAGQQDPDWTEPHYRYGVIPLLYYKLRLDIAEQAPRALAQVAVGSPEWWIYAPGVPLPHRHDWRVTPLGSGGLSISSALVVCHCGEFH